MTKRKKEPQRTAVKHPPCKPVLEWNRKGQEFRECEVCFKFMGFTGKVRR